MHYIWPATAAIIIIILLRIEQFSKKPFKEYKSFTQIIMLSRRFHKIDKCVGPKL